MGKVGCPVTTIYLIPNSLTLNKNQLPETLRLWGYNVLIKRVCGLSKRNQGSLWRILM